MPNTKKPHGYRLKQMRALDWENRSLTDLAAEMGVTPANAAHHRARLVREKYPERVQEKKLLTVEKAKSQLQSALLEYGQATGNAQALEMSLRLAVLPAADLVAHWRPANLRNLEQP